LDKTASPFRDLLSFSRHSESQPELGIASKTKENAVSENHLSAMRLKHAELETQLEAEENRPFPDDDLIHRLKKMKLQLKDAMASQLATV
jgi:hypothetical protein